MSERPSESRVTLSQAHVRLGQELKAMRRQLGVNTRQVPRPEHGGFFASGHISNVENGHTAPSEELIEAYVRLGADGPVLWSLYQQMRVATDAAARARRTGTSARQVRPPRSLRGVTSRVEVQQHYRVENQSVSCTFDELGVMRTFACSVALRARTVGTRLFCFGGSYSADRRRGVFGEPMVDGGRLIRVDESETGAIEGYVDLGRDLDPDDDEPHVLSYRLSIASSHPARPILVFHNFQGSYDHLSLAAAFLEPMMPTAFWHFGVEDTVDAEHPSPGQFMQPVPRLGTYQHQFDRLLPGHSYGFAWTWPTT